MKFEFAALGSGSRGNCYYIHYNGTRILLDAGLSARQTVKRLAELGIDAGSLTAIVITHEHSDHAAGLPVLSRQFQLPIWMNAKTKAALGALNFQEGLIRTFKTGAEFQLEAVSFHPFSVYHDAADPVGLLIEAGSVSLGLVEDLGHASMLVIETIKRCQALFLETNHDVELLMAGPYPWSIKNRINSRLGHLSNAAAAELLESVWHHDLQKIVLCHMSEVNNRPELALQSIHGALARLGADSVEVALAPQHRPTELMVLNGKSQGRCS
jgi:phosphoribosyl 1,2-cyclic phosphodiesterase